MDFEDWKKESVDDEMRAGLEIAGEYFDLDYLWNAAKEASKQHWLDKNISQRECYQRGHKAGFNQGIDQAVGVVNKLSDKTTMDCLGENIRIGKEIRKLKK